MLILTRKKGQAIVIDEQVEIYVSAVEGDQVKIGIKAPAHVKIVRKELLDAVEQSNKEALVIPKDLDMLRKIKDLKK